MRESGSTDTSRISLFGSGSIRPSVLALLLAFALTAVANAEPVSFDIKAQAMGPALRAFGDQARVQVFYPEDQVAGIKTAGLKGRFEIEAGLKELLKGSGLSFEKTDAKTFVIVRLPGQTAEGPAARFSQDVIVTAGKREEEVREVAGTVTPVTQEALDQQGAQSFADYLTTVPGVTFNETTPGISQVTMRGVGTTVFIDQGQQTTGYYINDIPMTEPYFSVGLPDLDSFDVDRVEVMRGPQGTLFGSATLGGAINYIPTRPSTESTQVRAEASSTATFNGKGADYGAKAMVNVPLGSTLALRAVLTTRKEAGYLDNVGAGVEGSNEVTVSGGRLALEWKPAERLTVSAFALLSRTDNKDSFAAFPELGDLKRDTVILEPFRLDTQVYSVRAEQVWDKAMLTASYAHTKKEQSQVSDFTRSLGLLFGNLLSPIPWPTEAYANGDIFEARLASVSGGRFDWLLGASYSLFKQDQSIDAYAPGSAAAIEAVWAPVFGPGVGKLTAPGDVWTTFDNYVEGREKALFGELTYRFDDHWRATAGGRYFDTSIDNSQSQSGFFTYISAGQLALQVASSQQESAFKPKFSVTYEHSRNAIFYGLVSTGFRFGGVNLAPPSTVYPSPATFGSDSLTNYELGARLAWPAQRLSLDVTPYYIDWRDIQVNMTRPDFQTYATNAGRARNIGVDVAFHARPAEAVSIDAAVGYLDATLREDTVISGQPVPAGTTLPGASKWMTALSASYSWKGSSQPSVTASYRYLSSAPANLQGTLDKGDYSLVDLRGRISLAGIRLEGFVENITDVRGVTAGTAFAGQAQTRYYVRPRTGGLRVVYELR